MRKEVNKFKKKITGGTYDKGRYPSAVANINRARRHGLLTDKEDEKLKDLAAIYFGWSKPKKNLGNRVKRGPMGYRPRTKSSVTKKKLPKKKKQPQSVIVPHKVMNITGTFTMDMYLGADGKTSIKLALERDRL